MRTLRLGLSIQQRGASNRKRVDWFVDSVSGSDASSGNFSASPKQTLGAIQAAIVGAPTKRSLMWKRGSYWREAFGIGLPSDLVISDYGLGDIVLIDGANVFTNWTPHPSAINVWEKVVTHDAISTNRLTAYEDGALLVRVADLVACTNTPGSFVDKKGSDGSPLTMQIHPNGSGNPNLNGKVYEVSTRTSALDFPLSSKGMVISGAHTQRAISNNGALVLGLDASVSRVLTVHGTKHNALLGSGSFSDVISCRFDPVTAYETSQTFFVSYTNDATGKATSYTRCGALVDAGGTQRGVAHIAHDSLGNSYEWSSFRQIWAVDNSNGWEPASYTAIVEGYFSDNCLAPFSCYTNNGTLDYFQFKYGANQQSIALRRLSSIGGIIHIRHAAIYSEGSFSSVIYLSSNLNNIALKISNTVICFPNPGARNFLDAGGGWSVGSLAVNNTVIVNAYIGIDVPIGVTYTGDNNIFVGTFRQKYQGVEYTDLNSWRNATGQDANSIHLATGVGLFAGLVANGDFRFANTSVGVQAVALLAGPQLYWDWNLRSAVSGTLKQWPIVPRTLADSKAYIQDPTAWNWS